MQYKYYEKLTLDPRRGNKFSTTYFKQTRQEKARLYEYVKDAASLLEGAAADDKELYDLLHSPIAKYTKLNGNKYTPMSIVEDLYRQLDAGKDATESMIKRWNGAFEMLVEDPNNIEMVEE